MRAPRLPWFVTPMRIAPSSPWPWIFALAIATVSPLQAQLVVVYDSADRVVGPVADLSPTSGLPSGSATAILEEGPLVGGINVVSDHLGNRSVYFTSTDCSGAAFLVSAGGGVPVMDYLAIVGNDNNSLYGAAKETIEQNLDSHSQRASGGGCLVIDETIQAVAAQFIRTTPFTPPYRIGLAAADVNLAGIPALSPWALGLFAAALVVSAAVAMRVHH